MVCDQPLINSGILKDIVSTFRKSEAEIIASEYSGDLGAPALIHRSLFSEICTLRRDSGASHVIREHQDNLIAISFSGGSLDIDTLAIISESLRERTSADISASEFLCSQNSRHLKQNGESLLRLTGQGL